MNSRPTHARPDPPSNGRPRERVEPDLDRQERSEPPKFLKVRDGSSFRVVGGVVKLVTPRLLRAVLRLAVTNA